MSPLKLSASVLTVSVVSLLLVITAEGETTPSCAQSLVPCANFINSTNPPSSCCEPLKDAINTQLTCLCNLYNTPGLLQSFGINKTEALLLPGRCKLSGDLNSCVKASGPSSSSHPPPPASTGKDNSGVSRIAGTGMLSMLLFSAYVALF